MIPRTQPLLFCLLVLCGLQEASPSPLGRCKQNLCSFQKAVDFEEARQACEHCGGQFLQYSSEEEIGKLTALLSGLGGKYWLRSDKARPDCRAVSVTSGLNATVVMEPCRDKLDGFFCQYGDTCGLLRVPGGVPVNYSFQGFEIGDSEAFPSGTIADARKAGGKYPDSKHLCFSKSWMRAPWTCEVFNGGCQHRCDDSLCACPVGQRLHANNISCAADPCAQCAQGCKREGDASACTCGKGYALAGDGRSCDDVDECKGAEVCPGQECVNMQGSYQCQCKERDFVFEEGACVNVSICKLCEHMLCEKIRGVYQCQCRRGFVVSPLDPTRCEQDCAEMNCPAQCVPREVGHGMDCSCRPGYIKDVENDTVFCTDINECEFQKMCDHECENSFGSFKCVCDEGYTLQAGGRCVKDYDDYGSGTTADITPAGTPASAHPNVLPPYVKTGSVLGIAGFAAVGAVMVVFALRSAFKRCGSFRLTAFKRPDIDIFYLQQVTTETYKRFSFDKPFKHDSQRLDSHH